MRRFGRVNVVALLLVGAGFGFCILATGASSLAADPPPIAVEGDAPIKDALAKRLGEKVTLKLLSGEEIGGTVRAVGAAGIHLTEVTGRELFEALVRLDHVSVLLVRTKR